MSKDASFKKISKLFSVPFAESVLASPMSVRATHYNFIDKTYICRLRYMKENPWRLVVSDSSDELEEIQGPDLQNLVSLDELCAYVVDSKCSEPKVKCVIYAADTCDLISEVLGKGKAIYYTKDITKALRTTVTEALDIIVGMKCSEEERAVMKILQVPY